MSVRMTEKAAEEFKAVCSNRSLPVEQTKLRVDAERSDREDKLLISLTLEDQAPRDDDVVETTGDAQLVINENLEEALGEVRIDYKEGNFVVERVQ